VIETLVGIPFKDRGRTRAGADCWGLAVIAYEETFGIQLESYADNYGPIGVRKRQELGDLIYKERRQFWERIDDERHGDLVLLKALGVESHVGIVVSKGLMLTTRRNSCAVIESYTNHRWSTRVVGTFRHITQV
jgi:cell wall-associated NlpC family hydrolase